jgi:sn-glycerol 3-phosphate transport system ATP-binding protein
VILLNRGRVEQNGSPVDLYETPANTFVARFIGTPPMNLLPLTPHRDGAAIDGTSGPAVLPSECAGGSLGVRPEHINVRVESGHAATVEGVEYLGGDSLVTCRLGATRVAVRTQGAVGLRRDDLVRLAWPGGAEHYFDASGSRAAIAPRDTETMLS